MTINPIYGFIGRSNHAAVMMLPPTYSGLAGTLQAALALGNEDPTAATMTHLAASLQRQRIAAGMPTDEHFFYGGERLYVRSDDGLAFVPVWGMLLNKCDWACSYMTGYDYLYNAVSAAMADDAVKGIVFDVDSFGGEAQGCMELSGFLYAQRDVKKMTAVCNNACSAGFAVASASHSVSAIPSANVGSVGVLMMHVDLSGYLKDAGIKVTLLHEGEHKVDGNPFEPLSADVKSDMQAMLKKHYDRFTGTVAKNRSMSVDAVVETQARVYDGADALGVGFVDAVQSPMAAVAAFANELSGSSSTPQEYAMSTQTTTPGAQATNPTTNPAAAAQTGPSAADERARIKAITTNAEAEGRKALAEHLAFNTSMSADEAVALLAVSPKTTPAASTPTTNPFESAMSNSDNPNVGANDPGKGSKANGEDKSAALLRDYKAAGGAVVN